MPKRIRNIVLTEVSHVDKGANQHAKMALVKSLSNPARPVNQPNIPGIDKGGSVMSDPKLQKALDDMESAKVAADLKVEKLTAELAVEKTATQSLTKHVEGEGRVVWKRDDKGNVTFEARGDEEYIEIEGERVLKSAVPGPMLKMASKVAELEKKAGEAELNKRVTTDIPTFGGDIEHRRALLKAVDSIADDAGDTPSATRDGVMAILKAASKIGKTAFSPVGTSDPNAADLSPRGELRKMAADIAKEEKLSSAEAMAKAMSTPEGRDLYRRRHEAA